MYVCIVECNLISIIRIESQSRSTILDSVLLDAFEITKTYLGCGEKFVASELRCGLYVLTKKTKKIHSFKSYHKLHRVCYMIMIYETGTNKL